MSTNTTYTVTERTAGVLDAIRAFHEFKELYFVGLAGVYEETDRSSILYQKDMAAILELERLLAGHLEVSVSVTMGTRPDCI